jgi:LmbE family N-acetylglucosaminyl deacetylase
MGFRLIRGGLPDGDLHFGNTLIKQVERWFREFEPAIVITHYLDPDHVDHQDHFVVAHAVLNVAQRLPKFDLLLEAEPSRGSRSFAPNMFVNVSQFAAEKEAAIACHQSQMHKHYFKAEHVDLRSRWWAEASGAREICGSEEKIAIEAFRIVRSSIMGEGSAIGFRGCERA